jgi:hypothetical protein
MPKIMDSAVLEIYPTVIRHWKLKGFHNMKILFYHLHLSLQVGVVITYYSHVRTFDLYNSKLQASSLSHCFSYHFSATPCGHVGLD